MSATSLNNEPKLPYWAREKFSNQERHGFSARRYILECHWVDRLDVTASLPTTSNRGETISTSVADEIAPEQAKRGLRRDPSRVGEVEFQNCKFVMVRIMVSLVVSSGTLFIDTYQCWR